MSRPTGNPRCEHCHGSGLVGRRGHYRVCTCIKGDAHQLTAQHVRRINTPGYKSLADRIAEIDRNRMPTTQERGINDR